MQGEPNTTFNLLTDKGLVYDGLFIPGDPPGVTLVGRTMLRLSSEGKQSLILFEPRKDIATIDGKPITASGESTADGGVTYAKGKDIETRTAEGYLITQHFKKGGGPWPRYIDAEVTTGSKGVSTDGVRPGGLLGQTFDADSDRRDGKRGKGAQGEGAIDGVYTDYMLERQSGFDEWFYLATYADVSAAVDRGEFSSGKQHYDNYGIHEARSINWSGDSIEFDGSST